MVFSFPEVLDPLLVMLDPGYVPFPGEFSRHPNPYAAGQAGSSGIASVC